MVHHESAEEAQAFEYDVQLTCEPDESLRERYPHMRVRSTEAQTALRRRVESPEELNALLVEISTVGLTLTDVHRVAGAADAPREAGVYEVRVVGELGGPLLRYLKCTHYSVQRQTIVRLTLGAGELHRFLQACAESGARLERVRRVGAPVLAGSR
ncbi:hypothetical protein [Nocardioides sp. zg-1230]|uniref:hypothetical protein n=1 Tax=Nocardioides sp. zg-1230 TaxID=2736601 RepID=UPI0015521D7C|nr:hypothetical protein [Nocardioides sp. zg-1230]NPC43662.1 hypothetical protein [Nocardioides sp. zg-1230]